MTGQICDFADRIPKLLNLNGIITFVFFHPLIRAMCVSRMKIVMILIYLFDCMLPFLCAIIITVLCYTSSIISHHPYRPSHVRYAITMFPLTALSTSRHL